MLPRRVEREASLMLTPSTACNESVSESQPSSFGPSRTADHARLELDHAKEGRQQRRLPAV